MLPNNAVSSKKRVQNHLTEYKYRISRRVTSNYREIIIFLIGICCIILGLLVFTNSESVASDLSLGLAVELAGTLLVFYVGLERIKDQLNIGVSNEYKLPVKDIFTLIENAEGKVKILDTWTYLINDDKYYDDFVNSLKSAVNNSDGVNVKILILQPKSEGEAARKRVIEGKVTRNGIPIIVEAEIQRSIQRLFELYLDLKQSNMNSRSTFDIKLYQKMQEQTIHMIDDVIYVSAYPDDKDATRSQHVKIPLELTLGKIFERAFENVWDDDDSILIDDFQLATITTNGSEQFKLLFWYSGTGNADNDSTIIYCSHPYKSDWNINLSNNDYNKKVTIEILGKIYTGERQILTAEESREPKQLLIEKYGFTEKLSQNNIQVMLINKIKES